MPTRKDMEEEGGLAYAVYHKHGYATLAEAAGLAAARRHLTLAETVAAVITLKEKLGCVGMPTQKDIQKEGGGLAYAVFQKHGYATVAEAAGLAARGRKHMGPGAKSLAGKAV